MTGPWRDGASGGTPITAAELNDIQAEVDKVGPIGESVDALADLVNTGRLSDEALAGSYAPASLADDVAAKVTRPSGGTDGQVLVRSGSSVTWATVSGGGSGYDGGVEF